MKVLLKLGLFAMVLASFTLFSVSSSYAKIDVKNLIGMWLFDEKNEPGKDYSGNGFDGTVAGNVKQIKGKFVDGVDVTGGGSITIPDDERFNFGDKRNFSVVIWINFSAAQEWTRIVRERTPGAWGAGNLGWELQTQGTQIHWSVDDKAGAHQQNTYDNVGNGDWHHTAMIVDRDQKMLISYLNGENEKKINIAAVGVITSELPVVIGGGFNGLIDEVAIFDGILELEDIVFIMNKGLNEAIIKGMSVDSLDKMTTMWGKIKGSK